MEAKTGAPMRTQARAGAGRSIFPSWNRLFRPLVAPRAPLRAEEVSPPPSLAEPEETPMGAQAGESPPMQFEQFSREWQNVSGQDNFDGFRLEAANQVTKQMQAAHTLFLGTQLRETGYIYQFGPAFQSEDGRTMLVARTGLDGGVNGRWIQRFGNLEVKASTASHLTEAQRNMHDGSLEYAGKDWTGAGKLAWQGALIMAGAFTQKVLPSLHLGGELTLVPTNGVTIGAIGARYASGKDIFTATLNRNPDPKSPIMANSHELRMQYVRKLNERLTLGTEFKYSHPDQESGMSVAYEYTFRQARVQGALDSEGKVSCCVSDFTGFGFSGQIDYVRSDYKFGVVMHVLPQPEQGQQPM